MPLRVAVDATCLLGPRTGVAVFCDGVLGELARRPDVHATAFSVTWRGRGRLAGRVPEGVEVRARPLPARPLHASWRRSGWPPIDPVIGAHDVVHGPNFVVPPSRSARIATVHDLTPDRFPEMCQAPVRRFPGLVRRAAAEGAWIHTVSHAVRDEILDRWDLDADRVVAVPNGADHMSGVADRGRVLAGGRPYVLAVGTIEPRKALPDLLRAFDRFAGDEPDAILVHIGGRGWGTDDFDRTLDELRHRDRVTCLGHRGRDDLADLYAGARVFAFPSLYEGFGLPVIEAFSAGTPTVISDVPALVEVAGDAALVAPVGDVDALADALTRAWHDDEWRAVASTRGRARAEGFTWERCADGLVDLYRRATSPSA